jgi:threonine dehydratase
MAYGAATIADELINTNIDWDIILVPVGNGSLIKGIASLFKEIKPATKIIGLVTSGAPVMEKAITGQNFDINEPTNTEADGLEVRIPIMKISEEVGCLIDDVWIIPESMLLPAVKTLMEYDQVMTEPSAAITIAACVKNRNLVAEKKVAAIITGSHLKSSLLTQVAKADTLLIN